MNQKTLSKSKTIEVVTLQMKRNDPILICEEPINNKDTAIKLLQKKIASSDREIFVVLCLDKKGYITTYHEAHIGTLNQSLIHPREIFKSAILSNASSIIVGHNHPSGDVTPSNSDLKVTKTLVETGKILDIAVLDHIIVSVKDAISLREKYDYIFRGN